MHKQRNRKTKTFKAVTFLYVFFWFTFDQTKIWCPAETQVATCVVRPEFDGLGSLVLGEGFLSPPGFLDVLYIAGSQTKPSIFNGFCQVGVGSKAWKKNGDESSQKCGWCVNLVISFALKNNSIVISCCSFLHHSHIHLHTAKGEASWMGHDVTPWRWVSPDDE